ncbi:hypothetical protein N7457_009582 [Penicillium paradoxum]|uniref:uncharacterized protein n=1 Tax=Penicillium paradoxum TaxID=176176 RepID=UPI00254709EA|nr:uncharacterized protein N7457_009582 [Penicillium paradoxum]KAJ5774686.1 hypothetical protein N7457_009582 [Penicillium paradoxum]
MEETVIKANLGIGGWDGAKEYEKDSGFHYRAIEFLKSIKWKTLIAICSQHRQGMPCRMSGKFSIGLSHMVRQVKFEDGELWVVRLRMPFFDGTPEIQAKQMLISEVASMRYLRWARILSNSKAKALTLKTSRLKTSIPVPEVFFYNDDPAEVGAVYMAMQYIPGTTAYNQRLMDPRAAIGTPRQDCFGTQEQDRKFRQHMAAIQVELASIQFDQIGSLYQNPETQEFYIGPDCESNEGPWSSAKEYYRDLALRSFREAARMCDQETQDDASFGLPFIFEKAMEIYTDKSLDRGPFGLVHQGCGARNVLVNEKYEILAVIDLDDMISAPIEIQAQFPSFIGLDRPIPFEVLTEPLFIERMKIVGPNLLIYKQLVEDCEKAIGRDLGISKLMLSESSAVVMALNGYNAHMLYMNQPWMASLLQLVRQKLVSTPAGN